MKMLDSITSSWPKSISQTACAAGADDHLFHHEPGHDDEKIAEMVARRQKEVAGTGSSLRVGAASEGAEVKLNRAG